MSDSVGISDQAPPSPLPLPLPVPVPVPVPDRIETRRTTEEEVGEEKIWYVTTEERGGHGGGIGLGRAVQTWTTLRPRCRWDRHLSVYQRAGFRVMLVSTRHYRRLTVCGDRSR